MITELSVIDNVWQIKERKIILYGASGGGEKMFNILHDAGIDIMCFCDGNSLKYGKTFCGKTIISKSQLKKYADDNTLDLLIIISSCYVMEITNDLHFNEIRCDICSSFAVSWGLYFSMQKEADVPAGAEEFWRKKKVFLTVNEISRNTLNSTVSGLSTGQLQKILFEENPIIAFQPAKVASSSICIELTEKGYKNVIHLHDIEMYFNEEHHATEEQKNIILEAIKQLPKIKIISGVRDPISRDLAYVFSGMGDGLAYNYGLNEYCDFVKFVQERLLVQIGIMPEKYLETTANAWPKYICSNIKYGSMFDWFDLEMKKFFGIDVYEESFDKVKGYTIIKKNNIELFLYKTEKLGRLEKELQKFTGVADFRVQQQNDSKNKSYYLTYQYIKDNLRLPEEYISFYYGNNPRVKHFYTDEEVNVFRKKWERK